MTHLQTAMLMLDQISAENNVAEKMREGQAISDKLERKQPTMGTWGWYGKRKGAK